MRLNKADRRSIISSIQAQLPAPPEKQKLDGLIRRTFVAKLPAPVRAIFDHQDLRPYVRSELFRIYDGDAYRSHSVPCADNVPADALTPKERERIQAAAKAYAAALQVQRDVLDDINAVLSTCATVQQARERLPEDLHKYLPDEASSKPSANLPAPRDVMQRLKRVGYGKTKPVGQAVGASA